MADLIVLTFEDEATGFALRSKMVELQKEYPLTMEDAVVVTKDENGKVRLTRQPI